MSATLHSDARGTVAAYRPEAPAQAAVRDRVLALLDGRPDACSRTCAPGHVTVGIVVLDPAGRTLLTLHPKFGRWLQLGGHLEPTDGSLLAAAAREAAEESGIPNLVLLPQVIDIDIHTVPCPAPGGAHHDVRFLALAPAGAIEACSEESLSLAWFNDLPAATDDSVRRPVTAARALLSALG